MHNIPPSMGVVLDDSGRWLAGGRKTVDINMFELSRFLLRCMES